MAVKTGNPETDAMFFELAKLTRECIDVPNESLPDEYRDHRSETTSLQFLHTRFQKLNPGPSQSKLDEAERKRRVELYSSQLVMEEHSNQEPTLVKGFEYEIDERKQYLAELTFCGSMVKAGLMEFDEV